MPRTQHLITMSLSLIGVLLESGGCSPEELISNTAAPPPEPTHTRSDAIVGGATDPTHSGVMALVVINTDGSAFICTASLVSTIQLVTAAHCINDPQHIKPGARWFVFPQTQLQNVPLSATLPVAAVTPHPYYSPGGSLYDVGIVTLQTPVSPASGIPLIRYNKYPLEYLFGANQPIQIIGYGYDNPSNPYSNGVRRQATVLSDNYDSYFVNYTDPNHDTCFGDSGGPGLVSEGGYPWMVGVTTDGLSSCTSGRASRSDIYLGWTAPFFTNTFYVASLYRDLLGRPADDVGLFGWTFAADSGAPRAGIARDFIAADEFMFPQVRSLYQLLLKRTPSDDEVKGWLPQYRHDGCCNLSQITVGIAGSLEYYNRNINPGFSSNSEITFVYGLYRDLLNRYPDLWTEVLYWVGQYYSITHNVVGYNAAAAAFVANGIANSDERHRNQVREVYLDFYRRNANETTEVGPWAGQLNAGLAIEAFIADVLADNEYRDRIANPRWDF